MLVIYALWRVFKALFRFVENIRAVDTVVGNPLRLGKINPIGAHIVPVVLGKLGKRQLGIVFSRYLRFG